MQKIVFLVTLLAALPSLAAEEIRHRFLAVDESRNQLVFVDQTDPAKSWTIKLPAKHRDVQLVGKNRVMLNSPEGYHEYNLADQKMVKEVKGFPGTQAARRLGDGRTVLACNFQGVTMIELGADDKPVRKATFKASQTRLMRLTPQDTFLFGCGKEIFEGDWSGKTVRTIALKQGEWVYQALRKSDGHLLAAGGYNPHVLELDPEGNVLRTLGGKESVEGKELHYHFFAGMHVLTNGNIVVCNWTGHGPKDSEKGVQLVEFNPAGQVVWKWHDPTCAGSLDGIIVLDNLDTAVLNDDVTGVLGPVK